MKVSDSILAGQRLTFSVLSFLLSHTQINIPGKKVSGCNRSFLQVVCSGKHLLVMWCLALLPITLEHLERKLGIFHSSVNIRGQ
ncbi:hypothetical protein Peur_054453 [Populus x canadensis]|jgi:hypothetical protein